MKRGVLFAGGGTLGPVTPLLAVASRIRESDSTLPLFWAGTDDGPERELVESHGIPFFTIPVAKLPRYASTKLLTFPIDYVRARKAAREVIKTAYPRVVLSAGGYTAVPIIREASEAGIPCIAHQLDYTPGLSNRLIASSCRYVTTSFPYFHSPFHVDVTVYQVPTPVRFSDSDLPSRESACKYFGFESDRPVLFVMGGGTGAKSLNDAMALIHGQLPSNLQIFHLTGKGKMTDVISDHPGYAMREFLTDEMPTAYAAADLVVSRAGVGAIAEIAATRKAAILVPLPNSPQEANAKELKDAVVTIDSAKSDWEQTLFTEIVRLLEDSAARKNLGNQLHDSFATDNGGALANLVMSVMV